MRVLLADDSQRFRSAAKRFLSLVPDLQVIGQACTGREALDQVERLSPDLVIMDVGMPEMDGLEATRHIKRRPEAPQVIILTLYDTDEYRDLAQRAGADGFVSKQEFGTALLALVEDLQAAARRVN